MRTFPEDISSFPFWIGVHIDQVLFFKLYIYIVVVSGIRFAPLHNYYIGLGIVLWSMIDWQILFNVRVDYLFSFFVLSYYVSLCSEFRIVMSFTVSA
jgi:hypothetical protein